ncbi:uncharacterized protein [Nicotiana sylvestris]|uniref:uncharacterized protein n=1 Tax=Nicotiana sylvestris TaxID=4096 RepID=UPI00388C3603
MKIACTKSSSGPWFIFGHFLFVQKWVPNFIASKAKISLAAIWIRLPQLPIEFYDGQILTKVGNKIAGHHKQEIHYEGINFLCKNYGRLGHSMASCIYTKQRSKPSISEGDNATSQSKALDTSSHGMQKGSSLPKEDPDTLLLSPRRKIDTRDSFDALDNPPINTNEITRSLGSIDTSCINEPIDVHLADSKTTQLNHMHSHNYSSTTNDALTPPKPNRMSHTNITNSTNIAYSLTNARLSNCMGNNTPPLLPNHVAKKLSSQSQMTNESYHISLSKSKQNLSNTTAPSNLKDIPIDINTASLTISITHSKNRNHYPSNIHINPTPPLDNAKDPNYSKKKISSNAITKAPTSPKHVQLSSSPKSSNEQPDFLHPTAITTRSSTPLVGRASPHGPCNNV